MKDIKIKKTSRFKKWTLQEKIVLTIVSVFFSVYAITLVYPFVYTFVNSLTAPTSKIQYFFSKELYWDNFKAAFLYEKNGETLMGMFWNSAWQTILATSLGMIASSCMAYVTARYDFKYLKFLYALGIFAMVVPVIGSTPAMYKLLSTLNIRNNPFLIGVIWFNGFGFSFLVLYSFFKSVSWTYAEAAFIDGASHFRTFISVMLPQAMPAVWSMFIVSAIGFWNDYMTVYLYLDEFPNVAYGLFAVQEDLKGIISRDCLEYYDILVGDRQVFYAMMLLSLIPIIIVFVAFQKIIMENVSTGGLKG